MRTQLTGVIVRQMSLFCALGILQSQSPVFAQSPAIQVGPSVQATPPIFIQSAAQLNNLVAPIALYPDPLISQVLAASTYPLEIVEAEQWLQRNGALSGAELENAAKQQDWDPSVQALVLFPDVLQLLSQNVRWTTDLGNAFLAQEAGVMDAVQTMRSQAMASGRLTTTPQSVVTTQPQGATTIVEIQPANPQVIYVPVYDPLEIWGPAYYSQPVVYYYPRRPVIIGSRFISFSSGVLVGSVFSGWNGWGGWGWRPNWAGRTVFVNNNFFYGNGFRRVVNIGGNHGGPAVWQHNPVHRTNVPYSNRVVETRFRNEVQRPQAIRTPQPARATNASLPAARAFAPAARVPGVSRSVPDNSARVNRREPSPAAPPNAAPSTVRQNRGFSGESSRPSGQAGQTFRSSPRPVAQPRSPEHSRSDAPRKNGTAERSAAKGGRGKPLKNRERARKNRQGVSL